ncbi:MAG TPA: molybdopterin-dependent oxidoreductase [Polyangiaceae bacterium]
MSRRTFLRSGLELCGSLLLGCSSEPLVVMGEMDAGSPEPSDPFAGGTLLAVVPFVSENDTPLEVAFNEGLDGRLYTDLSKLDPGHLVTPTEDFYVRTRYPDLLVPEERWRIQVVDLAGEATDLFLDELGDLVESQGTHLMECSGNARGAAFGLLSSAEWSGARLSDVLARFDRPSGATGVLVSGFDEYSMASVDNRSTPGASWVFRFDELERTDAFLATQLNGQLLPPDHGAPVRLLVPGWYGCTCIKWVNEIRFVDASEPSTSQMQEFASRTHQDGVPELASDYQPAEIDVAAMPVRVEKWRVGRRIVYRVVGIEWGGSAPVRNLEIRFGDGAWQPFSLPSLPDDARSWSLWQIAFRPPSPGTYAITLRVPDSTVRTRRLDTGYYLREVAIDEI